MSPLFEIPKIFSDFLEQRLKTFGYSLADPEKLAPAIIKLSDFFIRGLDPKKHEDYWEKKEFRAAYISYFSVLNFVRARSVFQEANRQKFFIQSQSLADWGAGSGAALWACFTENENLKISTHAYDRSRYALEELQQWSSLFGVKIDTKVQELKELSSADTLILSYVLNESETYPAIPSTCQRLVIIEPSTHQAGRKLLEFRDKMIAEGWFAWAPCTHQEFCPLYNQSGRDWCHHRVHWTKPLWFEDLERFIPMRNDTLTLSYLLLAREKPVRNLQGYARVVGDEQPERGKTRQMICRGVNREFLSWLDRNRLKPGLKRGDIIRIRDGIVKPKEIRISFMTDLEKINLE